MPKRYPEEFKKQVTAICVSGAPLATISEKYHISLNTLYRWRREYISRTIPDRDKLKRKVDQIAEEIKNIPECYSREQLIGEINRINSKVRGIIQYNQCCTWVSVSMDKHGRRLQLTAMRRLKQYKGKWIPANQTQNLPHIHQQYKQKIPSVKYRDIYVGFTALTFCRWEQTRYKNQAETP